MISATIAALLLVAGLAVVGPADAQVPFPEATPFSGYATGTVIHADLIEASGTRVEDTEVAFSGATINGGGLATQVFNELDREVQPALQGKNSWGRGTGLEVGLGVTPDDPNQVILAGEATASAPPDEGPIVEEIGPVPGDPLAYASLARGEALARWSQDACILGSDISRGLGYVADVQLLDAGGDTTEGDELDQPVVAAEHETPERSVSQSLSRNRLVRQVAQDGTVLGPNFGLMAETRQTIAPVTLFQNTPNQITLEFLGEWVLQAVASGLPGGAFVHYGPGEVSPETPVLRIIDDTGEVTNIVTSQDILGPEGVTIEVPGVAEITVGEDPRAIGGDADSSPAVAADGTSASGAVDVVRIQLLEQTDATGAVTFRASQIRVGHMETQAQVPVGGISCELPVTKSADPAQVNVGETFSTPITVTNPYDCTLTDVRISDEITTRGGATFTIMSTDPTADQATSGENLSSGTIVWNDVGPIPAGENVTVTAVIRADSGGFIEDTASATGTLSDCVGEDATVAGVAAAFEGAVLSGSASAQAQTTEVEADILPRTGPMAAATGAAGLFLLGLAGLARIVTRRF